MKQLTAAGALALLGISLAIVPGSAGAAPGITVGSTVSVRVAVATLWTSPSAPRPVDAKATSAPTDIRGWLAAMSAAARRGLVGKVETQALYGDRLLVTGVRPGWIHVVALGQPTHRDGRGYPGWVPTRQVTTHPPTATDLVATVTRTTTWLHTIHGERVIEVSVGTRLPVLDQHDVDIDVATPTGGTLVLAQAAAVVRASGTAALPRTASSVMTTARTFLGLPYLWGGRSGFAVDCSGLTELVYAMHGVVIPRDADDQAAAGRAAAAGHRRVADLVFFGPVNAIDHVGFYAGPGKMLHAPHTGTVVQISSLGTPTTARRFL